VDVCGEVADSCGYPWVELITGLRVEDERRHGEFEGLPGKDVE
jgi:hypothetical protein